MRLRNDSLPTINDAGTVAFLAQLDAGGSGIFTGPDPAADKVIATGDALFGSTVTALEFTRSLNDNGDAAFFYLLADGRQGIAVAALDGLEFEADFDGDGDVDGADLARWRAGYGTGTTHMQGNADADGDMDGGDFLVWQRQAGLGLPAVVAGAAALLMVAVGVALCRAPGQDDRATWPRHFAAARRLRKPGEANG